VIGIKPAPIPFGMTEAFFRTQVEACRLQAARDGLEHALLQYPMRWRGAMRAALASSEVTS
jgi:hypothetical protein